MESMLAASLDSELTIALLFSSALFLGLSFLIVLAVRSVPNKLLLLGLLVTITAVVFAAILPSAGKFIWALLIPAVALILVGALCLGIGFVVQLVKSNDTGSKKSSDQAVVEQK